MAPTGGGWQEEGLSDAGVCSAHDNAAGGASDGRAALLHGMSSKEVAVGVFSRAAPTYNSVGPRHFTHFARRLVDYVNVQPGDHVLDVATGTGEVLLAAAERCGDTGRLLGIDL